ncbi:hypothetical protein PMKS-003705 [Pichia membranifaciens]|uniref:Flavodoxin-like domain-containing protein n=1 Tax=Pichia membranifaciens TaxID=4926 RepID=A0A1Q2YKW4_9ASCO|nr:hypothetical protein PMKS-003705 [Pichia membranifaciens]
MTTNIAIVIYTMYHHVATLAEEIKKGVEAAGSTATIYQVPETLDDEILGKLYAPAKPDYPIATPEVLQAADGIIFGFPTRFGNLPAQMKAFIDSTGGLWQEGKLHHKPASAFISTGTGGGRETTIVSILSTLTHHGMIYIPLGTITAYAELADLSNVHGSSPWGVGTGQDFAIAVAKLTGKDDSKTAAAAPAKETAKPAAKPAAAAKAPAAPSAPAKKQKKKNPLSRLFAKLFH